MHWHAVLLVYFHWSLLNWRNSVAYSFCWYMIQLSIFYFALFCFSRPDYRDILLWYLEYGVCFCRQVLLTCPNAFVVLKIKISWFLIPEILVQPHMTGRAIMYDLFAISSDLELQAQILDIIIELPVITFRCAITCNFKDWSRDVLMSCLRFVICCGRTKFVTWS